MSQSTSYDVANRRVSVTDFNGDTTTSQYDTLGRVVTTSFPDGTSMNYSYTASGQIESVSGPQGTSRYSYDGDGRLTSVTDPNGATVSWATASTAATNAASLPSLEGLGVGFRLPAKSITSRRSLTRTPVFWNGPEMSSQTRFALSCILRERISPNALIFPLAERMDGAASAGTIVTRMWLKILVFNGLWRNNPRQPSGSIAPGLPR